MGLRRITAPVYVQTPEPTDPDWGVGGLPGIDNSLPGAGGHPWLPGHGGGPGGGPGIDNSLPGGGHIWGAWVKVLRWVFGPHVGGGPSKPPGRPILPPHADNGLPPSGDHIWGGGGNSGRWEILDPGFGRPPVIGWTPIDPGFGVGGGGGSTLPIPPGQWVPTDPDYGIPEGSGDCNCGKPKPPLWFYVFDPGDLAKPVPPAEAAPK